jgi:hypothetical protein
VPQTHMKPARPAGRPAGYGAREGGRPGGDGAYRAPRGDREYRRRDDAGDKEGAGAEYRPVSQREAMCSKCLECPADSCSASVVSAVVPVLPPRKHLCPMGLGCMRSGDGLCRARVHTFR